VKLVLRQRPGATFRFRGAQAVALFFLGFATGALLLGHAYLFVIFVVVAAFAGAWDMGWRLFVRH
jgi:hypothetical protein